MSTSNPGSPAREKLKSAFVLGTGAALLLALTLHASAGRLDGDFRFAARAVEFLLLAAALACSIGWIATLDEMAQRAHWGGSVGMMFAAAMVAMVASGAVGPLFFPGQPGSLSGAFASGMLAAMALIVLGYSIWWVIFWLRRRG